MAQQNKGKGRSRRSGSISTKGQNTLQHPGAVLAQILEDTPTALAAKWFNLSEAELLAVLEGRAPMTAAMAQQAGAVFGTGSAVRMGCVSCRDKCFAALMDLSKAERLEKDFLSRRSTFTDTLASEFWEALNQRFRRSVIVIESKGDVRFSTSACTSFPASDVSVFSSPFLGSERSRFIAGLGQLFMTSCVSVV